MSGCVRRVLGVVFLRFSVDLRCILSLSDSLHFLYNDKTVTACQKFTHSTTCAANDTRSNSKTTLSERTTADEYCAKCENETWVGRLVHLFPRRASKRNADYFPGSDCSASSRFERRCRSNGSPVHTRQPMIALQISTSAFRKSSDRHTEKPLTT